MSTPPTHLTGSYDSVIAAALNNVSAGDHSRQAVTVAGRDGTITPHFTDGRALDADDLAAQVYALAHRLTSDDGRYTGGHFAHGGTAYFVTAPLPTTPDSIDTI